jgi:N-acetylmuramoyl-L-alanine amidase
VRDLQRRLGDAGHPVTSVDPARFCDATRDALVAFQAARGLNADGICDETTWLALVESSWRLGDRLLVLTAPNLRGDDVGELQAALGRLGFDCGRVDGIFGPATVRALEDFQRNSGLLVDGVCGPVTVRALDLLGRQTGTGPGVAAVRELATFATSRAFGDLRIVVGQFGGLSSLTRQLARSLRQRGATVVPTDEPDPAAQAATANRFGATVYVGFEARAAACSTVSYYAVPTFESVAGRALADKIVHAFGHRVPELCPVVQGMRLPVLRETRMPAVLCALGPVQRAVDLSSGIAAAVVEALRVWAASPIGAASPT